MRSLCFFCLLALIALNGRAQQAAPALATGYCTLLATGFSFTRLTFRLNYGHNPARYLGLASEQVRRDNAELAELFTVPDALNYLATQGWECIGTSTLAAGNDRPVAAGSTDSAQPPGTTEIQYLLRRHR